MIECKVKINEYNYKVRVVGWNNSHLLMRDGEYHFGVTDYKEKVIWLANNLPEEAFINTLLHEVTHAYIDSYGMLQVKWDDEIVADFLSTHVISMGRTLESIANQMEKEERRNAKRRTRKNRTRSEKNKI